MDLTIDVEDYKLNIRAAGIIMHNNKILAHKNKKVGHYALIGGRIQTGESSAEAVKREVQEEIVSLKQKEKNIMKFYLYID